MNRNRVAYWLIVLILVAPVCLLQATQHNNWIVVTTIRYPTPALKQLAQLQDWRLVVIADKKTPQDWYLENCDFLSVEKQLELNYSIIPLLPWNHYSRKNIGYLYALEHGAQIIYETDDDTYLYQSGVVQLPEHTQVDVCVTKELTANVFAHFGQPSVWPRGYPLDRVLGYFSRICNNQRIRASIQQGVIDKDPDVDAIFRLTRSLPIYFNKHACPLALPSQVFCPFNTQSTLFYQSAFWGLLVPISVSFRVCDIWRGFWTQRLLWDLGAHLCFLPPYSFQERNDHNFLHDFADEIDLYLKSGKLLEFLRDWSCDAPTLSERFQALLNALLNHNFIGQSDIGLCKAWTYDLQHLGYVWPDVEV
jgi:hypothetical protein